jgi:hypothetical protein
MLPSVLCRLLDPHLMLNGSLAVKLAAHNPQTTCSKAFFDGLRCRQGATLTNWIGNKPVLQLQSLWSGRPEQVAEHSFMLSMLSTCACAITA